MDNEGHLERLRGGGRKFPGERKAGAKAPGDVGVLRVQAQKVTHPVCSTVEGRADLGWHRRWKRSSAPGQHAMGLYSAVTDDLAENKFPLHDQVINTVHA